MEKQKKEKQHGSRHFPKLKSSEGDASVNTANRRKVGRKPKRRRKLMAGIAPVSPSLDMNDEKTVLGILKRRLISEKKLVCETCGTVRKSAIGFLSHLHSCGKSPEECAQLRKPCEVCGRLMLSSSLQTHMYTVHKKTQEPVKEIVCESTTKRQAAIKAAELMQQFMEGDNKLSEGGSPTNNEFYTEGPIPKLNNRHIGYLKRILSKNGIASCRYPGCKFHTSTLEVLLDHLEICANKYKQVYFCKMCSFHTEENSNILSHIENEHNYRECSEGDSDDSDSNSTSLEEEEDLPGATSKNTLQCEKNRAQNEVGCLYRKRFSPSNSIRSCLSALKWTLEYQQHHYDQYLFPSLHTKLTDWVELSEKEAQEYLPETKESMFFASHDHIMMEKNLQSISIKCKKLALFEGDVLCGNPIFFVGGPVWSLAWCPLPLRWTIETYGKINQFIAVSCHKNMESTYCTGESYVHKGLIQIWNLGHLDNKSEGNVPVFCMGIVHEYGTVWCMEWCPSGCYDMQEKIDGTLLRIGLLAAACSDGSVRVYSVCDPIHLRSLKKNFKIFKPQPVASLVLDSKLSAEDQTWQCLCIAWHAGKGHRIIAGGFTNGVIAMWRMDFETWPLKLHEEQSRNILPYKVIQTNIGAVTAVVFSLGKDPRYLLTESVDHTVKFWDLEESHNPLVMNKKGNVATYNLQSIDWMSSHSRSSLHTFRGFGTDANSTVTQKSTLGALAANPWINAVAEATEAGEFSVTFVHQLLRHTDADKSKKSRRMMINHVGLLELKKYISDQYSSDFNNSFSLNNNKGLKGKSLDSDHREKPMSKIFFFKTIPEENSLTLQGKTEEHKFEIEFVLEENIAALKQCLRRDALESHIVINTAHDEALINNVHLSLHFQNSENEKDNNDANMSIEKFENEHNMIKEEKEVEKYDSENTYDNYNDYYDEKEQAEVDLTSQDHMTTNESNLLPPTDCFIESAVEVRHMRHLLERDTNDCQKENNHISKLSIDQVCLATKEGSPKRNSADTASDLCNIMFIQPSRSTKEECMTSDSVDQQGLKQCGTDKQAATNKPIKNNSISHSKTVCKMFNTSTNTQDADEKLSSVTDLIQQIPTSQKSRSNDDNFRCTQQLFLRSTSECNRSLYNKIDSSEEAALSVSDTDISFMQKRDSAPSSNNQTGESSDFYSSEKPSADTHKLRCSKPEVETYEDFSSSYGVVFSDFPENNTSDPATENRTCMCQSNLLRPADSTAYPILSINRAAWNPNCRSFLWLAAGYQCGFVRISCVSAVHTHMMDDIFRKAAWDINRKEKQKRTQF